MPASTSRRAGSIGPTELATITSFFVGGMPAGMCRAFRRFLFWFCARNGSEFESRRAGATPAPGSPPGANAPKEGGRSCPPCGLPATRERQKSAAPLGSHLAEQPNTG